MSIKPIPPTEALNHLLERADRMLADAPNRGGWIDIAELFYKAADLAVNYEHNLWKWEENEWCYIHNRTECGVCDEADAWAEAREAERDME